MTLKKVSYYKTKKYLREDEYFRQVQDALIKKLIANLKKTHEAKTIEFKKAS